MLRVIENGRIFGVENSVRFKLGLVLLALS